MTDPKVKSQSTRAGFEPTSFRRARNARLSMSPRRQLVPGLVLGAVAQSLHARDRIICFSISLAKQCLTSPTLGGRRPRVREFGGTFNPPSLELMQGCLLIDSKRGFRGREDEVSISSMAAIVTTSALTSLLGGPRGSSGS